jgi:hypothetical protein
MQRRRPAARQWNQVYTGDRLDSQRVQRRRAGDRDMGKADRHAGSGEAGHRMRHLYAARPRQRQRLGESVEQAERQPTPLVGGGRRQG